MLSTLARIALTSALVLSATACSSDSNAPSSTRTTANEAPDKTVMTTVELAKRSDVAALFEHILPPADFSRVKAEWKAENAEHPITDEDRKKFADHMAKLTAPDAEQTLYAEFSSTIEQFDAQYQQQMPMLISMGRGYLQAAIQQSQDLSANEKEQANNAINALAGWVEKTRFTDPELVKKAIAVVCESARALDLKTLDDVRALDFDQSAPKMQIAANGLKKLFDVYGLSLNDVLDSVKAETLSSEGDAAKVKISYSLLGTPLQTETDMVRIEQRWYGKDTIEKLKEAQAEDSQPTAVGED